MTPFAGNFNSAVAAVKDAAAEVAREKALISDALARERESMLVFVAMQFGPEVARRIRPALEAMDEPDGICDVRSRAMVSASAEDLLHGLGPSDGTFPIAGNGTGDRQLSQANGPVRRIGSSDRLRNETPERAGAQCESALTWGRLVREQVGVLPIGGFRRIRHGCERISRDCLGRPR